MIAAKNMIKNLIHLQIVYIAIALKILLFLPQLNNNRISNFNTKFLNQKFYNNNNY